jgi:radical S-adenosyl methionine domain-containing protein 2
LKANGVTRWKVFKVLRIDGENDKEVHNLDFTDAKFKLFVDRHSQLNLEEEFVMVPEDNDDLTRS